MTQTKLAKSRFWRAFAAAIVVGAPSLASAAGLSGCGDDDPRGDDQDRRVERYPDRDPDRYAPPRDLPPADEDVRYEPRYEPPPAEVVTTYESDLRPYGRWVDTPEYGRVWIPGDRPRDWRPYTVGRWECADDQWVWVPDEDEAAWGMVTYHYGRWYEHPSYGWTWVPGTAWAPAWVSWRQGGGYCGWAPLPPAVGDGRVVSVTVIDRYVPADRYTYCEERYLGDRDLRRRVVYRDERVYRSTTNITNITYVDNRVVNRGVAVERVEQASGRRVERVQMARASDVGEARRLRAAGRPVVYDPPAVRAAAPQVVQRGQRESQARNQNAGRSRDASGAAQERRPQDRNSQDRSPQDARRGTDGRLPPTVQPDPTLEHARQATEKQAQERQAQERQAQERRDAQARQTRDRSAGSRDRAEPAAGRIPGVQPPTPAQPQEDVRRAAEQQRQARERAAQQEQSSRAADAARQQQQARERAAQERAAQERQGQQRQPAQERQREQVPDRQRETDRSREAAPQREATPQRAAEQRRESQDRPDLPSRSPARAEPSREQPSREPSPAQRDRPDGKERAASPARETPTAQREAPAARDGDGRREPAARREVPPQRDGASRRD
jgi:hypothetical protein